MEREIEPIDSKKRNRDRNREGQKKEPETQKQGQAPVHTGMAGALGLGPTPYFPIRALVDSPIKRAFPTLPLLSFLSLLLSSSFLLFFSFLLPFLFVFLGLVSSIFL